MMAHPCCSGLPSNRQRLHIPSAAARPELARIGRGRMEGSARQKGSVVLDAEIKHADDVRMSQATDGLRFVDKALEVVAGDFRVQDFDGCLRFQIDVFTEVDIGEASFPKEVDEAVVPELLR